MVNYKAKQLSEEALQLAEKEDKRKAKKKMRDIPLSAAFQRIARTDFKKPSYVNNAKKQWKTTDWERLEISSRKLDITKEYFMQRTIKERNGMELIEAKDIKKRW